MKYYAGFGRTMRLAFALAEAKFWLRNAGSYIGIFWYVLEPLLFFFILLFLQGNIGISSIPMYPGYLLIGLIMINFFTGATSNAVRTMRENNGLVQSISVDTEAVPISAVLQFIFSHVFEFILYICIVFAFGELSWHMAWYIVIFAIYAVFVMGTSFILATLGVFIEDLNNIWSVVTRLLWLGTPIFYSLSAGNPLSIANTINPLYYFITFTRNTVLYGITPAPRTFIYLAIMALATYVVGFVFFMKNKRKFSEHL